jgi:hypothetical protein
MMRHAESKAPTKGPVRLPGRQRWRAVSNKPRESRRREKKAPRLGGAGSWAAECYRAGSVAQSRALQNSKILLAGSNPSKRGLTIRGKFIPRAKLARGDNTVTKNNNAGAERPKSPTVGRSSLQDQQFEERLRIAERIVQALLEARYSCEIVKE